MKLMDKEMKHVKAELAKFADPDCRVLDVGAGGGGWIPYLDHVGEIVALEPNPLLKPKIEQVAKQVLRHAKVTTFSGFVSDLPDEPKFDAVVLGNVLCEVPADQVGFLIDLNRRLRPGAKIIFLEHVRSKNPLVSAIQDLLNPWYTVVAGGCNCNRDSLKALKSIPGWTVSAEEFFSSSPFLIAPMVAGVAVKDGNQGSVGSGGKL